MNAAPLPVPGRVHFVWTGPGFALGQRLAIDSVRLTNPELEVVLHLVGACPPTTELERLHVRSGVTIRERSANEVLAAADDHGQLLETYQRIPARAASAQSNLLRYAILWQEGGIYLDLDVLVLRSLSSLRSQPCTLGAELVWRADEARVAGELDWWMLRPALAFASAQALRRGGVAVGAPVPERWHRWLEGAWSLAQPNNAVIAAAPRAPFVGALLSRAPQVDATVRFRLGPTLVREVAQAQPHAVRLLPPEALYCVPPSQSFRFFHDRRLTLPEQALLIHYVSSNHHRELATLAQHGPQALPRVAIVSDTTEDTNGVAIGLRRLIDVARSLGYPLELVGPTPGERTDHPRAGYTRIPSVYAHRLEAYPSYAWHVPHLPALLRYLCDEHVDIVQVATPGPMGVAAALAGRLLGLPVVGQYHTDVPRYAQHLLGDATAAQFVERFVISFYRSLDTIFVPSMFTAKDLLGKGIEERKLRKISRGVPVRDFEHAPVDAGLRARLCGSRDAFLVLYVGRVSREKNLEAALAGFEELRGSVPQAHFLIVGDGPLRAELVARQLEHVHLPGEVVGPALATLYASSDVFLFPSETDTFANAVVEATAAGLPVVTAQGSAAAEHCMHGVNGFVVDMADPGEIAMRLSWLLQNPALRARMAQESRQLSRRYDLTEAAHELYAQYAQLLRRAEPLTPGGAGKTSAANAGAAAASVAVASVAAVASPVP